MQIYEGSTYMLLFFIYGLAFFTMGISALLQNVPKDSNFPLARNIRYLGYFGITHGFTEWILMIIISGLFNKHEMKLFIAGTFFNSFSFAFLWYFGMKLLEREKENELENIKLLPWMIFTIWTIFFLRSYFLYYDMDIPWISIHNAMGRYFIGLPGGIITAVALFKNGDSLEKIKLKAMSLKIKGLALLFLTYGILAGFIVRPKDFFPANTINTQTFYQLFGFPVELGRTITAVAITLLFIALIDIFKWEMEQKIDSLSKQKIISQERRNLARDLHDVVIQNLFATGLQIENLIELDCSSEQNKILLGMKENLNSSIGQIRDFIKKVNSNIVEIDNLKFKLTDLINGLDSSHGLSIDLQYNIPDVTIGHLSSNKATQMYYIIQEAIYNVIKHANAAELTVTVSSSLSHVIAVIQDNGNGFDSLVVQKDNSFGLISMKDRAEDAKGSIMINSDENGTVVTVKIPWEEYIHDEEN